MTVNSIKEELIKKHNVPLDLTATSEKNYEHLQELAKQYLVANRQGKKELTLSSATDTKPLRKNVWLS
ncbi:hypothetical protein A6V39_00895 [Candidatus Mycoplasma haematobovis]|uniref:Uncharacterized protein n=1 Tax=Candidatus Mycoplasma haematobovis TaxID=432608 RepID=A0A1A9QFW3_9MOLU|nr:hypothetical protein [Candidatus Mycoplasma haematobovis]OAL10609.1 hypothetical protein A6V39_00895 [Candidatus Mycoplasma haematobovis]